MTLQLWLKSARAARGMTQEDLGQAIGVDSAYISKIERGRDIPSSAVLERLAPALGLDLDELFIAAGRLPERYVRALQNRPVEALRLLEQFASQDPTL